MISWNNVKQVNENAGETEKSMVGDEEPYRAAHEEPHGPDEQLLLLLQSLL